jgi:glyoxylase-like metal-dependent hydrolase (beta-lactamase superfamily II)
MRSPISVHRLQSNLFPVNAYLVEGAETVVAVDATLGMTDGRRLRALARTMGKPLAGVVVTHSHPDHYGGITALLHNRHSPVYAVAGVDDVIRRDDAVKEEILRPMFGKEWAARRTFPNHRVDDGAKVTLGDVVFRVIDAGPCESPHDSWWALDGDGPLRIFVGDLVYSHMHAYLADGHYEQWLANIARAKRELPGDVQLFMGHGEPAIGHALLDWQAEYINRVVETVGTLARRDGLGPDALADAVAERMKAFLPTDDLLFLARLSVAPLRERILSHAS